MDAVNALHGINMDVPDPIRDYGDCNANGVLENCTGLDITTYRMPDLVAARGARAVPLASLRVLHGRASG